MEEFDPFLEMVNHRAATKKIRQMLLFFSILPISFHASSNVPCPGILAHVANSAVK